MKRLTILLLMLLIAVLLAGLSGLYHALKAQEAQRQLEAVKMQQEFRKLNEDFTAELKQQNELRIREREEAARNAGKLQSELLKLHKERASEAAKLEEKLAASRAAFQQQLAELALIRKEFHISASSTPARSGPSGYARCGSRARALLCGS